MVRDHPHLFQDDKFFHRGNDEILPGNAPALADWPDARGVWVCQSAPIAILVNEEDHLQLTSSDDDGDLQSAFERVYRLVTEIQTVLERDGASFTYDAHLGYVTSHPAHLGTALNIDVTARLTHLSRRQEELRDLSHRLGLRCTSSSSSSSSSSDDDGLVHITQSASLGHSEIEVLHAVAMGSHLLLQLEGALAKGERPF